LFAGGGTGGHVYPAIAIADAVRDLAPEAEIRFAGTREKMEWEAVPKAGYRIHQITISGLHRGQPLRNLTLPFKLVKSMMESRKLVKQFDPDVAVGTGGYVSGPVLFTASLRGKPIVIQEQNAYAGLTNRFLGKRAHRIHVAFLEAKDFLPSGKCVYSGNPTRKDLTRADSVEARRFYDLPPDAFVLVVFGGSLGSRAINEAMRSNVSELLQDESLWIIWQTGRQYFKDVKRRVPEHPRLNVLEYIDRMDLTYAAANLAACRSGAITCSELMVTGTPAILIPSPNVAEDHQTHNARAMANAGAAVLVPEAEMESRLANQIAELKSDPTRLRAMSDAGRAIARPEAARDIAKDVLQIARSNSKGPGRRSGSEC
jgi:UDP-N-acetylglucosamine--N-acetylmuramyl-(pentapeptide) pyrophosphoryl-undecaprenol N-acetylglucosamine transferase